MMAMQYGNVYVGRVAMGANDAHTVKTFIEAEAHPGPSIIIAYSHCIAHGYNMLHGFDQQKAAVQSGHFPLFRYNPALAAEGKNPFQLDSKAPSISFDKYAYNETRYTMLVRSNPEAAKRAARAGAAGCAGPLQALRAHGVHAGQLAPARRESKCRT